MSAAGEVESMHSNIPGLGLQFSFSLLEQFPVGEP